MSAIFEIVFGAIFEVAFEVLIEGTGRLLIWLFTGGRVRVTDKKQQEKLALPGERAPRARTVSSTVATFIGIAFWAAVGAGIWWWVSQGGA